MVIDFHIHMFPDRLAERAIRSLAENCGGIPQSDGTVRDTKQKMQEAGVTLGVVQNIATNPRQMRNVNLFAIETDKEKEFVAFGSVHPDGDWETELDFLKENGIRGIKLHPDYQDFYVDDPKMQPIYEGILKRGFVLLFHSGIDEGLPDPVHCPPERVVKTLGLFRGEKVVFAHSGGFGCWDEVAEKLIGEDIYLDTSMTAFYLEKEKREALYRGHDENKLLFATDFPWAKQKENIEAIGQLSIPEEQKEKILWKNAVRLLALDAAEKA